MFQRHRSAPLLAGCKWSLPAVATASYYRQTYPKAHAHDRLVGYMFYNYYSMGARLLSQVRSSVVVSRVAHARRVIYAEIDAITVHICTGKRRHMLPRSRYNTRDYNIAFYITLLPIRKRIERRKAYADESNTERRYTLVYNINITT